MIVRPALADEAAALARLGAEALRAAFERDIPADHLEAYLASSFTRERTAAELEDPRVRVLVVESAGALAGYAKLERGPAPSCVAAAAPTELVRMYLLPTHYGRGAGRALMTASLELADGLGCDVVWLKVWDRNHRAHTFYARWAFSEVGATELALVDGVPASTLRMRILARPVRN